LLEGESIPGTLCRSGGGSARGWVVLHGMTRMGRAHPELLRFVRALASTGASVLVPEIREWVDLEFAPERSRAIIRAAVDWHHAAPTTASGGVVLVGFSFGAPQALLVAAEPPVSKRIRGVVGWGGYEDIGRTFRFSLTGEHEWEGVQYHQRPDPYARWVIGTNCLPLSPALGDRGALISALRRLAVETGEKRLHPAESSFDPFRDAIRAALPPEDRALFDLFAPPLNKEPDREATLALVEELTPLIRREMPSIEPASLIGSLDSPVRLLHSRSDHLIPFTETLRLGRALEEKAADLTTRLTGLFSHSGDPIEGATGSRVLENVRFIGALRGVFAIS
jgi:pimeloyl-ACP methyl ester carboxylesterase